MSTLPHLNQPAPLSRDLTRRTVNRAGLGAGIIAALLATGSSRAAQEGGTPVPASRATEPSPIRYALTGDQIEIVFTPGAGRDLLRLEYHDETEALTFTGDEIDLSDHPALGPVASVLLRATPDAYVDYLALLLPAVNPIADTTDVPIETVAIMIRHLTSIGGPRLVSGPLQTYDVRSLSGVATFGSA